MSQHVSGSPVGTKKASEAPLLANALGLPGVVMQAVTHIAPAVGLISGLAFIASVTGLVAPVAIFVAFLIILMMGTSVAQLAKHLPGAGGFYTYVSHAVGPRSGFMTSWMYFLYDPISGPITVAFGAAILQDSLQAEYNITFPWWLTFLIFYVIITTLTYLGIQISTRSIVITGTVEILIMVALGITGVLHAGAGGVNASPFDLTHIPRNFFLGVVFAVSLFTGFESVAPLSEESKTPRRTLPRAIFIAILIMGVFYLFNPWADLIGWGTHNVASFASSADPFTALAHRLWGVGWIVVVLALLNSCFAEAVAGQNAVTRVYYGMARSGALPRWLAYVHPKYRTPWHALHFQTFLNIAVGIGLGFWIGGTGEFFYGSIQLTLALILVYVLGNLSVFRLYRGEYRTEFNVVLHVVFPVLTTAVLIYLFYKTLIPLPTGYLAAAPIVVLVWAVIGVAIIFITTRMGHGEWLSRAGRVFHEEPQATGRAADPPGAGERH